MCVCVGMCLWEQVATEARRGRWSPWAVVTVIISCLMWVQGTAFGTSVKVVFICKHWPSLWPCNVLLRPCYRVCPPEPVGISGYGSQHLHWTTQWENNLKARSREISARAPELCFFYFNFVTCVAGDWTLALHARQVLYTRLYPQLYLLILKLR